MTYLENLIADKQNILGLCQQWANETNTKDHFWVDFSFNLWSSSHILQVSAKQLARGCMKSDWGSTLNWTLYDRDVACRTQVNLHTHKNSHTVQTFRNRKTVTSRHTHTHSRPQALKALDVLLNILVSSLSCQNPKGWKAQERERVLWSLRLLQIVPYCWARHCRGGGFCLLHQRGQSHWLPSHTSTTDH